MDYAVINGTIMPTASAVIGISDLALQRGYGIFDYFKVINNQAVFLEDHLDRFYNSAGKLRLEVGYTREELKQLISKLLNKNAAQDSGIKILLTGGYSSDGFNTGSSNLVITQSKLPSYGDAYANGLKVISYQHQRQMPDIKTIDYLMAIWLQPLLKEQQAQDVIYFDGKLVTECPRSNVFIVTSDGKILTPAQNVLKGIIRKSLLKLNGKFNIAEADISLNDLYNADEVFVTSTTKNILPVVKVDDRSINEGKPGNITTQLSAALDLMIRENAVVEKIR